MKIVGLMVVVALLLAGCASFQRSQVIETDKLDGYASGNYRDDSSGRTGEFALAGSEPASGSAFGFGALGTIIKTGPPPSGAYDFAKAIAMINYSKKLKSIKYDETGRIIEYEFDQRPLSQATVYPPAQAPEVFRLSARSMRGATVMNSKIICLLSALVVFAGCTQNFPSTVTTPYPPHTYNPLATPIPPGNPNQTFDPLEVEKAAMPG